MLTMRFTGKLVSFEIDMARYKTKLHEQLLEDLERAAFAWLDMVLSEVPDWSGASRATFLHLARKIGYSIQFESSVISRKAFGANHGKGEITTDKAKGLYTFMYSTDLEWLVSNEYKHNTKKNDPSVFYRLLRPGPYHFQKAGKAAFERESRGVRLPNPWKSLKLTSHRIKAK
jgi:hypothetical protein